MSAIPKLHDFHMIHDDQTVPIWLCVTCGFRWPSYSRPDSGDPVFKLFKVMCREVMARRILDAGFTSESLKILSVRSAVTINGILSVILFISVLVALVLSVASLVGRSGRSRSPSNLNPPDPLPPARSPDLVDTIVPPSRKERLRKTPSAPPSSGADPEDLASWTVPLERTSLKGESLTSSEMKDVGNGRCPDCMTSGKFQVSIIDKYGYSCSVCGSGFNGGPFETIRTTIRSPGIDRPG